MKVIIKPIVTEKMTKAGDTLNKYGFIVSKEANKLQVKKAVEEMYEVSVESVNTTRYGGDVKTRYTKGGVVTGRTNGYKKAIVTLTEGNKIDFYRNI